MKSLIAFVAVLCIDCVSCFVLRHIQDPPAKNETVKNEALSGPAHRDNFQEEIVDQADPEFKMASFGDDCINLTDAEQPYREAWENGEHAREHVNETEGETEVSQEEMLADVKEQFEHFDSNHDGCINITEFNAAGEMEGPPPGYQEDLIDEVGEEEFEEMMQEEEACEFRAMDRNGDKKISASEAYHYTSEHLPNADLGQQDLQHMFEDCDLNHDKFLDFDEFTHCGPNHEGDGNEMEQATPMKFLRRKNQSRVVPLARKMFELQPCKAAAKAKKASKMKQTRLALITTVLGVHLPKTFLGRLDYH